MKEILAFLRTNKVNSTKKALASAGFPAFVCRACMGRGKKGLDPALLKYAMETGSLPVSKVGESFTEGSRLIPKRAFMVVVEDDQVELAVKTIIKANQTDHPGDGKIFVLPVSESFRVRTGENAL